MKRRPFILAVVLLATAAFAAEPQAVYLGGTSKLAAGSAGQFDTTGADQLVFETSGGKLAIPYGRIQSFESNSKLAHHLGVLPVAAVVLVAPLHRKHFLKISYRDDANVAQVAIFEVAKHVPRTIMPILEARAPKQCNTPYTCAVRR
jgi:hypothetical protein